MASGKYDAAISNITVTKARKEKFNFATYRADNHAFAVKSDSKITAINAPADDAASATLSLLSGRADAMFGPHSMAAWKVASCGHTRLVVSGPFCAWGRSPRKGNGLAPALQAAIDDAISGGQYQQVLTRWGEQDEAIAHSAVNPPGIQY